jgi:hypothetical protein
MFPRVGLCSRGWPDNPIENTRPLPDFDCSVQPHSELVEESVPDVSCEPDQRMFCPNCGQQVQTETARFCARCGSKLPDPAGRDVVEGSSHSVSGSAKQASPPAQQVEVTSPGEAVAPSDPAPSKQKAAPRKWGWGWYVLGGLMVMQLKKPPYAGYGIISVYTEAGPIATALVLYFYLRNKWLSKTNNTATRSFAAGVISYVIVGMSAAFVMRIAADKLEARCAQELDSLVNRMKGQADELQTKEELLWSKLNPQAVTKAEMQTNILVLGEIAELSERKVAFAESLFQTMLSITRSYSDDYPAMTNTLNVAVGAMQGLREKLPRLRAAGSRMVEDVTACYTSALEERTSPSDCSRVLESHLVRLEELTSEVMAYVSQLQPGRSRQSGTPRNK